jgi:hypothetical protein
MTVHRSFASLAWGLLAIIALACGQSPRGAGSGGAGPGSSASVGSGVTTGSGTTAGGGGGAKSTCGDAAIEPGEDCDGSDLGSATCTSLGFSSGALACTSTCHFDTSACSGTITPTVTASRMSCAAPCGVFFDATGTTGLMNGDFVGANFDWDFDSTNVDPNGAHEQTVGFVVGHVFDAPGTYHVAVRVRDTAGKSGSTSISISVTAMPGTTYYVAANGSDNNAGTMASPLATLAKALAIAKPPASILFQRGDTFDIGDQTTSLTITGPFLIGAYGPAAAPAPILTTTVSTPYAPILAVSNSTDVRFVDLHFKTTQGTFELLPVASSTNTLSERVEVEGIGNAQLEGQVYYVDHDSHDTFVVDGKIHDFWGFGLYTDASQQVAVIGTSMLKISGGEEALRIQGGEGLAGDAAMDTYVAECTAMFVDGAGTAESFTFRGHDEHVVYVGNTGNHYVSFAPQNMDVGANEYVSYVLAEGNTLEYTFPGDPYSLGFVVTAQHVVVRNNLFVNTGTAVGVVGEGAAGPLPLDWVDDVAVYNNTHYVFPPVGGDAYLNDGFVSIYHNQTTGSIIVKNNVFVEGALSDSGVFQSDQMSAKETVDHNLVFAPNAQSPLSNNGGTGMGGVVGDPKFAATDLSQPKAFQLTAGSAAIDVGVMVPVYRDKIGVLRPQGAGWDMGAFELKP